MNNVLLSIISGVVGFASGSGVTELLHKGKDRKMSAIEKAVCEFHTNDTFRKIKDLDKRDEISNRFVSIIEKAYQTKSSKEAIFIMTTELGILQENMLLITEDDNYDDYKEVTDGFSEENREDFHEGFNENTEETDYREDVSEEEQSPVLSQETVPVEDDDDPHDINVQGDEVSGYEYDDDVDDVEESQTQMTEEAIALETTPENEIDEEKFSELLHEYGKPLLEKYGDQYEDRLLRMLDRMSSTYVTKAVVNDYSNKLRSALECPDKVRGVKKLTSAINGFFKLFPPDADLYR